MKKLRGRTITFEAEVRKQILLNWRSSLRSKTSEKHFTYNTQVINTSGLCQTIKTGFEEFNIITGSMNKQCDAKFATKDEKHYSTNALTGVSFLIPQSNQSIAITSPTVMRSQVEYKKKITPGKLVTVQRRTQMKGLEMCFWKGLEKRVYVCACSAYKKMTEEHAPATHSNMVEWTVIIICSMNLVWGNEIFSVELAAT